MTIETWNIQGQRNKEGKIIRELENGKQDIIVLSQTKKKRNDIETKGQYIQRGAKTSKSKERSVNNDEENYRSMLQNGEPIEKI